LQNQPLMLRCPLEVISWPAATSSLFSTTLLTCMPQCAQLPAAGAHAPDPAECQSC
jgi:hypothetical protein